MSRKAPSPTADDSETGSKKAPRAAERAPSFPVVGIGASAGGFEAISGLLEKLPAECGMAFVIVQHLDPTHASSLTELLAKKCKLAVKQVSDGVRVEANQVYVIPPNTGLDIRDGLLHLNPRAIRDLTDVKQAHDRALQAERLAAIGEMSAGLAHESRNALQRSQACLEMLQREITDRPRALEMVERIQQAQNHLLRLYEEMRGYAAPILLRRQQNDLRAAIQQAWENLEPSRKDRVVQFRSEPKKVDTRCEFDVDQMERVFRNILENALQACTDPVEIDVRWSDVSLDGRPALRVGLRNNGPSLSPDQARRMFEAFFTTKTQGTGLGMTIAKRIVDAHGGRIEASSSDSQGVEIMVTLPRTKP